MKIEHFFAALPDLQDGGEETFDEIVSSGDVTVERIVSNGHASPPGFWYDQPRHEWVMVLRGRAGLQFLEDGAEDGENSEILEMGPGDHVHIPAHRKHRVAWTSSEEPTIWIAVHYPRPSR